jgi:HEPN domain-containing protein
MRNKPLKRPLKPYLFTLPRTHDLQSLLLLIRNYGASVPSEIEQASALTRFAVEARYLGNIEPITPEEGAERHLGKRSVTQE